MKRGKNGSSGGGRNGLLPKSLRIISSCLKTVSTNAGSVASSVRSAGASVAASIVAPTDDEKDQVLWAGFDKFELSPSRFKNVLLLGYTNGFQVLDVEDASDVHELVSKRGGPVTFLQMQPIPAKSEGPEGFRSSHPILSVVAGDETNGSGSVQVGPPNALMKDAGSESQSGNQISTPTVVRFFSLKSNSEVHVLRFRSAVYVVRCSPRIVAVALAAQIYCFDSITYENKFSVLTYPMQGAPGVNIGYGPMAIGPRWLAYASNNPLMSNTGRLSPQNLTPPGVSPSTSPSSGNLVARYAMESSKQLAAGIINLGDMGYKTFSKYCHEFLPDGSNPSMSTSGRKVGRLTSSAHPSEADNAGMVVVKDFVSKEVISQFRAHSSPISALCFDPSGMLLVTASVHGNNINVFRIMRNSIPNASNSAHLEWSSSHVHLYKLYRGLTTAVIQDISFSHYSQWISVVSSRGTCHIYMLSPFGGETGIQTPGLHKDGQAFMRNPSLPWWSTSSCMIDRHFFPPPPPITLSVVSRIKNGNSGWLNSVSSAAASAAGKTPIPSGAVASVFHNCVHGSLREPKSSPMEHLLVYSPSGHVIQHELVPSLVAELSDSTSRVGASHQYQIQDEELRISAEPVQWWDVCRRANWPEREEFMSSMTIDKEETAEMSVDVSDCEDNESKCSGSSVSSPRKDFTKANQRHLANAEVRGSYGHIPIWQKSKICFYTLNPPDDSWKSADDCIGEIEIEKISVQEVEIRHKDLLPVFQHFHNVHYDWHDRSLGNKRYPASLGSDHATADLDLKQNSRQSAPVSGECLETGNLLNLEDMNSSNSPRSLQAKELGTAGSAKNSNVMGAIVNIQANTRSESIPGLSEITAEQDFSSSSAKHLYVNKSTTDSCVANGPTSLASDHSSGQVGNLEFNSKDDLKRHVATITGKDIPLATSKVQGSLDVLEYGHYLQEGYCKLSELDDCHDSNEAATDGDSNSSQCEREKAEEDGDNDGLLGGVFAFSEEG